MTHATMRELLEKIRPLLRDPQQAQRLWSLWLVEQREGREWIEQILEIEYNRLVRPMERQVLLLPPPPRDLAAGRITIGDVLYNNHVLYPFGIPDKKALLQHTAIFGRSGAGKTNLVFKLLSQIEKQNVPYWILDWKRDYRPLVSEKQDTLVFTVGRDPSPFLFNPLLPPLGCSREIERYIGKVIDIVGRAFYVGHGVKALLSRAFHALLQKWQQDPESNPITFQAALKWIRDYNPRADAGRRTGDWKESTIRALEQLCIGQFGRGLNVCPGIEPDHLLDRKVIFELDALDNDQKLFFTEVLLLWLRERFLADLGERPREQLRLMLVVEEAHNILKTGQERNATETMLEKTLRETRSLGMGLIVIDQTPAYVSKVATSNVFTSLYLSLQGRNNVTAAADALLLSDEQRDLLGRLPVGMAVCRMQDHWHDPFLIKIPLMQIKQTVVSDDDVTKHMRRFEALLGGVSGYSGRGDYESPTSEAIPVIFAAGNKGISDEDKAFLLDIAERPFVGMANRYKHLDVSTRHGNNIRHKLEKQGLVAVREINTGKAQVKIPELTRDGVAAIRELGHDAGINGSPGSLEHRYWVHRIAEHYREKGYEVTVERDLGNQKRVDVEAVKGGERIAIEIETGKSDIKANLAKLDGRDYTKIILAYTSSTAKTLCVRAAVDADVSVEVKPANGF